MRNSVTAIKAGLAVLVLTGAAAPAGAQSVLKERLVHREVVVPFHDLDPEDARDAAILLSRIDKAAEEACGGRPWLVNSDANTSFIREDYRRCHEEAVARAVDRVGASAVKRQLADRD